VGRVAVNSSRYLVPVDGFSHAIEVPAGAGMLLVSGLTSRESDGTIVSEGDVGGQMRQILKQLAAVLAERSLSLDDVVRVRTYTRDIESWPAVEEAFRESFGDVWPASTFVEVTRLYDPRQLVELEAVAVVPQ
jgi:enamine deaminase RidA (YjgF/YER057c/UK114 family)